MERSTTDARDESREEALSFGRRRFVRWLGLGGLAAALGGFGTREASAQATPATSPATPATPAAPPLSDEAKALHAILVGRYGAHLDDAQKEALLPALEQSVQSGKALRGRTLGNSVEPDTIFRAEAPRREGEGTPAR